MRWLLLAVLAGCGHVSLGQAITAHNVFSQMLVDASESYTAVYGAAAASNMGKTDADYSAVMKPYDAVVIAMNDAHQAEVVLQAQLEQCIAVNDGNCDGARIGFACAASALDLLSTSYGQIRGGAPLYAAAAIAKAQLSELADGKTCEVSSGSP